MNPLQYIRWRVGTRRATVRTLRHIEASGVEPRALVDAGARRSEFMRPLAKRWPRAEVVSFEPDGRFNPLGYCYRVRLGTERSISLDDKDETVVRERLDHYSFAWPALLKVDCDKDTLDVLTGADLRAFTWAVVEVMEDGFPGLRNNRSEVETLMRGAGFDQSKAVDAVVYVTRQRVAQTDVLYWRSK